MAADVTRQLANLAQHQAELSRTKQCLGSASNAAVPCAMDTRSIALAIEDGERARALQLSGGKLEKSFDIQCRQLRTATALVAHF